MPRHRLLLPLYVASLVLTVAAPTRAIAQEHVVGHVRPEPALRALVADAEQRSQTVRDLVDRLDRSDVTVYIRMRRFEDSTLDGRVALLSRTPLQRFLVVELACGRSWVDQVVTLGHELRHAVEIADEPAVVDLPTLAALYRRIGMRMNFELSPMMRFDTDAARRSGRLVWREYMAGRRTVDGS